MKARFHAIGMSALILGTMSLLGVVVELVMMGRGEHLQVGASFAVEVAALLAVGLAAFSRATGIRTRWLFACFARERTRQWHFQLFNDGRLVERLVRNEPGAERAISRHWEAFQESLKHGSGTLTEYMRRGASRHFHSRTPYSDESIAAEVFDALEILRFRHQLQYGQRRIASAMSDRAQWADIAAGIALFAAVALPSLHLLAMIMDRDGHGFYSAGPTLSAAALGFAVLSASIRAFKSGYTVPDEIESYEEYVRQIDGLYVLMSAAQSNQERGDVLWQLETEAAEELRRFLRIKSRAAFLL